MDKMRKHMGLVMIILILAFMVTIVFNWGSGGFEAFGKNRDVVGVVNGEKISIQSFYQSYNNALEQYRNAGIKVDARTSEAILQQTWETVVSQTLWNQQIEKMNIKVSDEELYYYLEANPPEFLQTQEAFMTDGAFDYGKYMNALRNPQGNEWIEIERYLRENVLPYQKLNDIIVSSVVVDEAEVLQAFTDQSVIYSAEYIEAPVHLLPDSIFEVFEEDLLENYEANKDELYKKDQSRDIRYVYWLKVPSSEDTAATLYNLEDIAFRHEEGEDFNELANIFSELSDDKTTGELGWFNLKDIRREYKDAVSSAKKGDVLEPILIDNEYHLLKVNDTKRTTEGREVNISLIIRTIDPLNTYDYFATEAEAFTLDYESYGFDKALQNVDAQFDTLKGNFSKEYPYFGALGYFPALAKWAYRSEVGDLSTVYENENAFVVAQLIAIVEESYIPFEDVKPSLERSVIASLKTEKAHKLLKEAHNTFVNDKKTLEDIAKGNEYLQYNSLSSTINDLPYPYGSSPVFADVLRQLSIDKTSNPFETGRYGSAFVHLTARSAIDEELYNQQYDELKQALLEEKQMDAYEAWMEELRNNAVIKDYRVEFGLN
ncbi:MAG: SurA N-terminal domain-containing protein [Candidatus Neomarinimicrobiota bacterium]